MIDIGIEYVDLGVGYMIGIGVTILMNLMIMSNQELHFKSKWLYLAAPLIFGVVLYFGLGIIFYYVGWTI